MNKETNRELCQIIQDFTQTYLSTLNNMSSERAVSIADENTVAKIRGIGFQREGRPVKEVVAEMMENVYSHQALLQHPRYFAFIPGPVSPLSWLGDIMTSAYNPCACTWLESSSASCIEQEVVKWLCLQLGYPEIAGGLFVSGGSIANLAALTAARNAKLSENQYGIGVAYISTQTHMSAAKGLRIIGFRGDQIKKIPCDDNYRMETSSLEKAIINDQAAGKKPFVVVASAGTTNTGSIDPINDIANICEKYNLWLHVDGAYGASILLSQKFKGLLDGVSRSDSVSWDAHKWLMQTYSCSALLVRDKQCLINGFSANPEYYKDAKATDNEIDYWEFGPEMTRPARSLKLWVTLQVLGIEAMGQMVEYGVQLAEWAEDEIKKQENWEIISPAQLGIVNFRYVPPGFTDEQLDMLNTKISDAIVKDGFAFVLTTILAGKTVLRMIAIHPDTTEEDIRKTVQLIAKYAIEAGLARD